MADSTLPVALVDADRQVKAGRLVVDREEIGIAGGAVAAFDALLEDTAGAVILGPTNFLHCFVDIEQRQNGDPAQPAAALLRGFGDPAVVGLAKRHVGLRPIGKSVQEKSRVEHLHVDAQLVHVAHAGFHVEQLARCFYRSSSLVIAPAPESDVAVDDPEAMRPGVARRRRSSRIECNRLEAAFTIVEVFPGCFRLVYMGIDVYAKHGSSLRAHQELLRL